MIYTIVKLPPVLSFFIWVAQVPRKNYLLPAVLFFLDSALFCASSILQILRMLFLCKNFLEILRNSSPCWKSLFLAEANNFIMGTNLSNQLMMSFVWREFSRGWRKMIKKIQECQELKLGDAPDTSKKYSRILKHLSLGMPPCIPFFINNYQFALLHTIFLSLHMLCALLGTSCFYFSVFLCLV